MHEILPQQAESLRESIAINPEIPLASRSIALLGTVSAGKPLEPFEDRNQILVPKILLSGGDVLVVKRQSTAEDGQTVVAIVNGEATVKRFYRQESRVELRPANPALQPIIVDSATVEIRGLVIGLIRKP